MKQSTSRLLMVRPAGFRHNEETADNSFQQNGALAEEVIESQAVEEFDAFVDVLRSKGVHVAVFDADDEADTPDALFPNNWISFHEDGRVAIYPMMAENRRRERREHFIYDLSNTFGLDVEEIVDFTEFEDHNRFLEGTGSMVLDRVNKVCYAALSERTDEHAVGLFCATFGYSSVCFNTLHPSGKPVYHTNVVMSIGTSFAVVCTEVIDGTSARQRVINELEKSGRRVLEITLDQLNNFAGNVLEVRTEEDRACIVMSRKAYEAFTPVQREALSVCGELLVVDLNTIETYGGGSARCMLCEVFLPKI